MRMMKITYKTSKKISATAILSLFRRNEWREWFAPKDADDLLRHAIFVASAWQGPKAVGIATLFGDGRFYVHLDTLLVDEQFRRQGIGTTLMDLVMQKVAKLKPHYCEHDTHEDWLVSFYERFGFEVGDRPQLTHKPTNDGLARYVEKRRRRLSKRKDCQPGAPADADKPRR